MRTVIRTIGWVFALCCAVLSIGLFVNLVIPNAVTNEYDWNAFVFGILFGAFALGTGLVLFIGREPGKAVSRFGKVLGWSLFAVASLFALMFAVAVLTDPDY